MTEATRAAAWVNRETQVHLDESSASLERLAGGNSNETYLLADGETTLVVRRPPRHTLDASAHSMSREHRVIRALDPTPVPNAPLVGYCDDLDVLGVDFLVSAYMEGSVSLYDELPPAYTPGAGSLVPLGESLVDVLAQLQAVDWRGAGLEGFGRPDGFLERQVPRWEGQYRKHQVRDLPDFERVTAWLREQLPVQQPAALMHGDFHLDNCLYSSDEPRLMAVVDWEMATVGDPLVDLGLCLAFWGPRHVEPVAMPRVQGLSRAEGSPTREQLAERYAEATGRDVTHLRWYEAFALWKLGVVIEPAYAQYLRGELTTPYAASLEHDVPALFAEAAAFAGLE